MTNWVKDMNAMHNKYDIHSVVNKMDSEKLKTFLDFRIGCLQEEIDELKESKTSDDAVDAIIDLCVFAIGTLDLFDIDAHVAWKRVLEANMNKDVGIKEGRPNPFGLPDLIKPEGWQAPSHIDNVGKLIKIFDE